MQAWAQHFWQVGRLADVPTSCCVAASELVHQGRIKLLHRAGPLKGILASLPRSQGQASSTALRFRCGPSLTVWRCSLSGAVGPDASLVGSHEAHDAPVEKTDEANP